MTGDFGSIVGNDAWLDFSIETPPTAPASIHARIVSICSGLSLLPSIGMAGISLPVINRYRRLSALLKAIPGLQVQAAHLDGGRVAAVAARGEDRVDIFVGGGGRKTPRR